MNNCLTHCIDVDLLCRDDKVIVKVASSGNKALLLTSMFLNRARSYCAWQGKRIRLVDGFAQLPLYLDNVAVL